MKKVTKVNEAKIEVITVTVETLKADLVALKNSYNSNEKLGADFIRNVIEANLQKEDLKNLFEECKKILAESYAKKVCSAINIAYTLGVKNDAEKMGILSNKGFNNLYTQLREWKNGKKEIVDSKQAVKVKSESVTQKRNDANEAKKSKENHLENAIANSASLADVFDLLTSLGEMAKNSKDDARILSFLALKLLEIEDATYEMTA